MALVVHGDREHPSAHGAGHFEGPDDHACAFVRDIAEPVYGMGHKDERSRIYVEQAELWAHGTAHELLDAQVGAHDLV